MQVSQIAYDRYVVELPPADAEWRPLADPETIAETASWLWHFGPTPLVAIVGYSGAAPSWIASWSPHDVRWAPQGTITGAGIVVMSLEVLERFLREGAPHAHTVLMWPRVSPAKTFEGLNNPGANWKNTVDAIANIIKAGERFEVTQVA